MGITRSIVVVHNLTMTVQHFFKLVVYIQIIFAVVAFAQKTTLSEKKFCGFQHSDDYIRESNATSLDDFPWVAALVYKFFNDGARAVLCSGVLINRRYVLTAAQCLTHPRASVLVAVRLGEYNIKNETDCIVTTRFEEDCTKAKDFGIEEKIVHPQYNRQTRANDIALVRITTTINEFTDYIRPICLFPIGPIYAEIGDTLHVSGWGRQLHNGQPAEIKKNIATALITNEKCAKEFSGRIVTENHVCTRDLQTNAVFTCQGDAGAPVMFVYGSIPQWHLEGISSWGGQCGYELPQVHTRVSNYLDWIQDNIRK